jgi:hypothetical protein
MNKEQLLIPRYKVVSEWPDMLERFSIGYIFEHPYGRQYLTEKSKYDPADFPAMFKKLQWWEERTTEEMPNYITIIDENVIVKVEEHSNGVGFTFKESDYFTNDHPRRKVYSNNTMPSCEEDFLSSLANKKGLNK